MILIGLAKHVTSVSEDAIMLKLVLWLVHQKDCDVILIIA